MGSAVWHQPHQAFTRPWQATAGPSKDADLDGAEEGSLLRPRPLMGELAALTSVALTREEAHGESDASTGT